MAGKHRLAVARHQGAHRAKVAHRKGKHHVISEATRKKIAAALKGKHHTGGHHGSHGKQHPAQGH